MNKKNGELSEMVKQENLQVFRGLYLYPALREVKTREARPGGGR